jgi:hypothetical protein
MTKPDDTKIAVIQTNIEYIKKDITEIKDSVKSLAGVYATQLSLDSLKMEIMERLDRLEKSSNLWKWLSPTLTAIITAIGTFLVLNYIQNI